MKHILLTISLILLSIYPKAQNLDIIDRLSIDTTQINDCIRKSIETNASLPSNSHLHHYTIYHLFDSCQHAKKDYLNYTFIDSMKIIRCIIPQTSDSSNIYVQSFFLCDSLDNVVAKGYGYNYHIFPFKGQYDNLLNHPEKELINLYKDGTVDFIFTTGNKNDVDFEYYGLSDIYYGVNKMTNQMYIIIVTLYGLECFDFETIINDNWDDFIIGLPKLKEEVYQRQRYINNTSNNYDQTIDIVQKYQLDTLTTSNFIKTQIRDNSKFDTSNISKIYSIYYFSLIPNTISYESLMNYSFIDSLNPIYLHPEKKDQKQFKKRYKTNEQGNVLDDNIGFLSTSSCIYDNCDCLIAQLSPLSLSPLHRSVRDKNIYQHNSEMKRLLDAKKIDLIFGIIDLPFNLYWGVNIDERKIYPIFQTSIGSKIFNMETMGHYLYEKITSQSQIYSGLGCYMEELYECIKMETIIRNLERGDNVRIYKDSITIER